MSQGAGEMGRKCPICGKVSEHAYRPFCSRRCSDIDLGRWLTGGYVIEGTPEDDSSDDPEHLGPRH